MRPIDEWVKIAYAKRKVQLFGNNCSDSDSAGSDSDSEATDTQPDSVRTEDSGDED